MQSVEQSKKGEKLIETQRNVQKFDKYLSIHTKLKKVKLLKLKRKKRSSLPDFTDIKIDERRIFWTNIHQQIR